MAPPRTLYRIEWREARAFDRPCDRAEKQRNFTSASYAAAQVASIHAWPHHHELTGCYETVRPSGVGDDALEWSPIDPTDLPLREDDAEKYRSLVAAWKTNPIFTAMLKRHGFPLPDEEAPE